MLSLSKRVLVSMLVGFVIGVLVVSLYTLHSIKQVRRVAAYAQASALVAGYDRTQDINQLPSSFNNDLISYTLYSHKGEVLSFSDNRTKPLKLKPKVVYNNSWLPDLETHGDRIGVPVTLLNGDILMVSQIDNTNRVLIEQVVFESIKVMLVALLHLTVLFSFIVYWTVKWTLSPVRKAALATDKISVSNPLPIPTEQQPKEILPLIQSVNSAVDRLTKSYHAQQRFIADAAHELRTPLTVLKLRLNRIQDSNLKDLKQAQVDVEQIQNLTDKLLELARLESVMLAPDSQPDSVNIVRLLRESIAENYPLFEQSNRNIILEHYTQPVTVTGYPHLLSLSFKNLIDNAFHHGKGDLKINAQSNVEGNIDIYFSDEGLTPPVEIQNTLFKRFKKADNISRGSGLGLSIVAQVVRHHRGSVSFRHSKHTRIRVRIPAAFN